MSGWERRREMKCAGGPATRRELLMSHPEPRGPACPSEEQAGPQPETRFCPQSPEGCNPLAWLPFSPCTGEGEVECPTADQLPLLRQQPLHQRQGQRHLCLRWGLGLQLGVGARRAPKQEEAPDGGQLSSAGQASNKNCLSPPSSYPPFSSSLEPSEPFKRLYFFFPLSPFFLNFIFT